MGDGDHGYFISVFILIFILFVVNILRRKNKTIHENKLKVDKLNELQQKIFNVISHDFNGSFMTLQFLLDEFIVSNFSKKEFEIQIEEVKSYLNQSNYVLQNLTNWAKIELGEFKQLETEYAIQNLLNQVQKQLEFQMKNKNLEFENKIPIEITTKIPQDYLSIVFRNIINNAIKFSEKNKKIIASFDDGKIKITDYGIGIKPEKLNKLFLNKVDSEMGTNNEFGFGIGLKIVHEIVEKFDGKITIQSVENQGTIVSVKL